MTIYTPTTGAFLRMRQVCALTGLSRATIYRMIAAKTFPAGVNLSPRLTVWLEGEVREWMNQQVVKCRGIA